MTNLPPYSGEHPRCTKCGNNGAHTRFITDMVGERLKRECARCGYAARPVRQDQRARPNQWPHHTQHHRSPP